jgi:ATP-binding cassette subfamily F protein 3
MVSKDILKNALLKFDGTLIIVSHDRDFLQGLTTKVYEFKNKTIKQHLGDIYTFLDSKKLTSLKDLERKSAIKSQELKAQPSSDSKVQWEKKKEQEKLLRKLSNKISASEKIIENLEKELKKMDEVLMDPLTYKDALNSEGLFEKYQQMKVQLKTELDAWEKYILEKESIKEE